jgi:putative transposase
MVLVTAQSATLGVAPTCEALAVPRASYYRWRQPPAAVEAPKPPRRVPRALPPEERERVLAILHDERFVDLPPAEVYATLLDAGTYVCSPRTMYRILHEHAEVRERRRQLRHPRYQAPELLATQPNQLWSWDITKLKGPVKWTYFYLYVILDVFSRYVVGWIDRSPAGVGDFGPAAHRRDVRPARDRPGPVDDPCGSRSRDDRQVGGRAAGGFVLDKGDVGYL